MDGLYRGFETSLLALSLALGLAVAALAGPSSPTDSITLAMIEVVADAR